MKERALVFLMVALLAACGGGGGGGDVASAAAPAVAAPATPPCPDGSAVPAKGVAACPKVSAAAPASLADVADPDVIDGGVTIAFSGTLDPGSLTAVLWKGAAGTGTKIAGEVSLAANGKDVTYLAVQRLAFGEPLYTWVFDALDTVGNPVHLERQFATAAMVCADNAVWSNPATFSDVYRDCVAGIGIQVKIDQAYNKMQDTTCTMTLGAPLSTECQAYLANGTVMLANTSIVANSHLATWAVFVGADGKSNLVLLDTNNPADASPAPVASLALSSPLSWIIGNTTGALIKTADGKTSRASLDATNNIVLTCLAGC